MWRKKLVSKLRDTIVVGPIDFCLDDNNDDGRAFFKTAKHRSLGSGTELISDAPTAGRCGICSGRCSMGHDDTLLSPCGLLPHEEHELFPPDRGKRFPFASCSRCR